MSAEKTIKRILISRTDSIGDVMLTLPLCGIIKSHDTNTELVFLGRTYTRPVIDCCGHISEFVDWSVLEKLDESEQVEFFRNLKLDIVIHVFPNKTIARVAKLAGINKRIGTTGRIYHWLYCNDLVLLSRRNSVLHEAQLNIRLAKNIIGNTNYEWNNLKDYYGFSAPEISDSAVSNLIDINKYNLILHPKSKGSAREWPLSKYKSLVESLPEDQYTIFISGTPEEGILLKDWLETLPTRVYNITGKLSLTGFISFISKADGLIAASTGPLHIAAALGRFALGLYPPIRPMDPLRWAPLGSNAHYLVLDKKCSACRDNPSECFCMKDLEVMDVIKKIQKNSTKA